MNKQTLITILITLGALAVVGVVIYFSMSNKTNNPITNPDSIGTGDQLAKHNTRGDCWVAVSGVNFDVTGFIDMHPSGPDKIIAFCGKDATETFLSKHNEKAKQKLDTMKVSP